MRSLAAIGFLVQATKEAHFLGINLFYENMVNIFMQTLTYKIKSPFYGQVRTPSRILFLTTCILVILSGMLATTASRLKHLGTLQDFLEVVIMLGTAPHFLFFCRLESMKFKLPIIVTANEIKIQKKYICIIFRGVKIVGPFVIMIYRMIKGDLLRFVTIYAIFAMGFSQGKSIYL